MRQSQHNKRTRGRGRKPGNPGSRVYESNGPDVKVRGNASHVAEKYVNLARDASVSGDPVAAENYLQHAEHYFRLVAAAQSQAQQEQAQNRTRHGSEQPGNRPQGGAESGPDSGPDSGSDEKTSDSNNDNTEKAAKPEAVTEERDEAKSTGRQKRPQATRRRRVETVASEGTDGEAALQAFNGGTAIEKPDDAAPEAENDEAPVSSSDEEVVPTEDVVKVDAEL